MSKRLFAKKTVFAKIETTYGTDINPSAAPANAVQTKKLSITPIEADELKREIDNGALGAKPTLLAGKHVIIEFDVDMAGSGTAGVAPAYAPLLLGCGMAENDLSADVDPRFEYDPVSESFSALSFHVYVDGVWHKLVGARGTWSIKTAIKGFCDFHFRFLGLFVPVSEQSVPARDYTAYKIPVPGSAANTDVTLGGKALAMTTFDLDMAGELVHHETSAAEEILLTNRGFKGSISFESPKVSAPELEFDVWSRAADKATSALVFQHGQSAGNIVSITGPAIEVGKPAYEEKNKLTLVKMPFSALPVDSDDEIKLIIK